MKKLLYLTAVIGLVGLTACVPPPDSHRPAPRKPAPTHMAPAPEQKPAPTHMAPAPEHKAAADNHDNGRPTQPEQHREKAPHQDQGHLNTNHDKQHDQPKH